MTGCVDRRGTLREDGISLLSQQCWCWGRDILRPQGNWLLENGFERIEPPPDLENCPSTYRLTQGGNRSIVLRGFGVFFGTTGLGGVFLPRYDFTPRYTEHSTLSCPPWTEAELPPLKLPNADNRNHCALLLLGLVDWIRRYEVNVVERLGLDYRRQTLARWNNGRRSFTPAEKFASEWRRISFRIADNFDNLLSERSKANAIG